PPPAEVAPYRTPRVFQFAAWVAIVAGIVFIVSVIFFTGYSLGRHSGHGGFHRGHKHPAMMWHRHPQGGPQGGPGATPPGGAPSVAPGGPGGPSQIPSSVAPSRTTTP